MHDPQTDAREVAPEHNDHHGGFSVRKRLGGLFRDAWYLAIVVVLSGAAMWIWLAPIMGVVAIVAGLLTFVYFGIVRYDDDGHERTDSRA